MESSTDPYHIAISEVLVVEFGINLANNTIILNAQNSKLSMLMETLDTSEYG